MYVTFKIRHFVERDRNIQFEFVRHFVKRDRNIQRVSVRHVRLARTRLCAVAVRRGVIGGVSWYDQQNGFLFINAFLDNIYFVSVYNVTVT